MQQNKRKIQTTEVSDDFKWARTETIPAAAEENTIELGSVIPTEGCIGIQQLNPQQQLSDTLISDVPSTSVPVNMSSLAAQSTLTVSLDEILQLNGRIAFVKAQNYLGQNVQRSCQLRALRQENVVVWSTTVLANIAFLMANRDWVAMASQHGDIFCYQIMSGTLVMSLRLDHPVTKLILSDHFCAVQTNNNQIFVWDLEQRKLSGKFAITSIVQRNYDKNSNFVLSRTGIPVIFIKNGDMWYFSRRKHAWHQIQTGINMLTSIMTHLEFIQKIFPTGLISKVVVNKKGLKPANLPSALISEEAEDEQMELLLSALDEMDYPDEYSLLACVYIHRLVSRGKVRRLHIYKRTLKNISGTSNIDVDTVLEEIEDLLRDYPLIKRELVELESPSNGEDDVYMEEDLGFLSSDYY